MLRLGRKITESSGHRPRHHGRYLWVTLLLCASCSSDPSSPGGDSGAANDAGSGGRAGNSAHAGAHSGGSGSSGHPGTSGGTGEAGKGDTGGGTGTGGEWALGGGAGSTGGGSDTGGTVGAGGASGSGGASAGSDGPGAGGAPAGTGGTSAGTGGTSAGTGGTSAGTGGTSAGTGGTSAGTGGTSAGTGGTSAGTGGTSAGAGGAQSGSFTLSTTSLAWGSDCPFAKTFTVANTSSVPLTWHLSGGMSGFTISPLGSVLAVGGAVEVSVLPVGITSYKHVSVDADIAPSQAVDIVFPVNAPVVLALPPDIDFGDVPVGSSKEVYISVNSIGFSNVSGPRLSITNSPPFTLWGSTGPTGGPPGQVSGGFGWTLRFSPQTPGPQQTQLTAGGMSYVCPPNSFVARATAVAP
ncbi:MAG TPA: hypothetical protein VER96_31880 [Polyangiaceae bacterium]|nr:hypothetical protein [Polyangiaceae bacterium]